MMFLVWGGLIVVFVVKEWPEAPRMGKHHKELKNRLNELRKRGQDDPTEPR